jgi:hypothetical protein
MGLFGGNKTGERAKRSGSSSPGARSRPWRYGLALTIAVLLVALVLTALLGGGQLCREVTSNGEAVKECGPPTLTELAPFALLIGLLFAPELAELSIAGLLSLKRDVESTREQFQRFEDYSAPAVEQGLSNQLDSDKIEAKRAAVAQASDEPPPEVPADAEATLKKEREERIKELRALGDEIAAWWNVARRADDPSFLSRLAVYLETSPSQRELLLTPEDKFALANLPRELTAAEARQLVRWGSVFEEEIRSTLAVVRGLDTRTPPSDDLIRQAVDAGRRLVNLLPEQSGWS